MLHELKKPGIVPETAVSSPTYDASCRRCVRLATYLDEMRETHPGYRCLPVPPFGDADARLVVVGLAPGLHGANATGRPFTGDFAGILLYETLHAYGYASSPISRSADDPLALTDCRISNAVNLWYLGIYDQLQAARDIDPTLEGVATPLATPPLLPNSGSPVVSPNEGYGG